ncbi:hypothetical protein [Collinsella sp. An2]|uniref:hypothetical protein n=1 Tax=Collinsella sp. An2 TaxID=1965585 RepID=UPI000B560203|nr:hypothetical protein [Collinsella sp. An2]OUP10437.1 hypothetical protein B5F33_02360 [Collinsella sp. An2]
MASTQKYLNHLLQNTGITPACSEEERAAAEDLARIFANHGFSPEMQEFSASGSRKLVLAGLGVVAFVGAVLMGVGGAAGIVGLLLTVVAAVLYTMERTGRPVLSSFGAGGLSQNVIAYHKASGPLASPRNRPVVVVAHYDSPRADIFSRMPYASYRPAISKLLPLAMIAPAVVAIVRLLPLPGAVKTVLWLAAIVVALVPLANAVAVFLNRFVLPYTSGSVCNKSSVASMLGVMDAVAPYERGDEFPEDTPFEEYYAEQQRIAAEQLAAAQQAAEPDYSDYLDDAEQPVDEAYDAEAFEEEQAEFEETPADDEAAAETESDVPATPAADPLGSTVAMQMPTDFFDESAPAAAVAEESAAEPSADTDLVADEDALDASAVEEYVAEEEQRGPLNAAGNYRFGADAIYALGMVSESTILEYVEPEPAPAPKRVVPAPAAVVAEPEPQEASAEVFAADVAPAAVPAPAPAAPAAEADEASFDEVPPDAEKTGVFPAVADAEVSERIDVETVSEVSDEAFDEPARRERPEIPYRPPVRHQPIQQVSPSRPAFAETLANVREGASRFLSTALQFGKDAVEKIESTARNLTGASEEDQYEDITPEDLQAAEGFEEPAETGEAVTDEFVEDGFADDSFEGEDEAVDAEPFEEGNDTAESDEASWTEESEAPALEATAVFQPLSTHDGATQAGFTVVPDAAEEAELESEDAFGADDADDVEATADDMPEPVDSVGYDSADVEPVAEPQEAAAPAGTGEVDVYGDTQLFVMPPMDDAAASSAAPVAPAPEATVATPAAPKPAPSVAVTSTQAAAPAPEPAPAAEVSEEETIDSLMAEITAKRPPAPRPARTTRPAFRTVPDPAQPSLNQTPVSSRSSLFDLPDPSSTPADPFVSDHEAASARRVPAPPSVDQDAAEPASQAASSPFETISVPDTSRSQGKGRSRGGLFHRKRQEESSMSDWLGVDEDFDAKRTGGDIGSWDNFDDGWKGGATGAEGVSERELRDAITSMADDELLGHDIWFVATGASEYDNAGMKAFLSTHRDKLRGVFLINLECVGAGQLAMVATEGENRVLKGDKRITNLVRKVSAAFHNEFASVEMPYETTDAYAAMSMSLRSLTVAGIDGPNFACSHSEVDLPYNVNPENVDLVADVVTEVIRRS